MKPLLKKCRSCLAQVFSGYFNQLLISLILLFIFRPYGRGIVYITVWEAVFTFVILSAIFNCNHSGKLKIAATLFGIPAIIVHWIYLLFPFFPFAVTFLVLTIAFIFITTASIIRRVVINARVRVETLKGVVCAYFMIAFAFAFLFHLIELVAPGSFHFSLLDIATISHSRIISEMMYFSFVTVLCIGYGDITAVRDVAQTCAILEGIIGQFYIAILVARLVSVYSFFEHKLHLTAKKASENCD